MSHSLLSVSIQDIKVRKMKLKSILLALGAYLLPKVLSRSPYIGPDYVDLTQDELEQLKEQCQNDLLAPNNTFGNPSQTSRFILLLENTSAVNKDTMSKKEFLEAITKILDETETIQKLKNEFSGKKEEIDIYTIAVFNTQLELTHIDMNQHGESIERKDLESFFEKLYDNLSSKKEGRLYDSLGCLLANYVNEKRLIISEAINDNNYFYPGYWQIGGNWFDNDRIFDRLKINRVDSMTRKNGSITGDGMYGYIKYLKAKIDVKNGNATWTDEYRIDEFESRNKLGQYWEAMF